VERCLACEADLERRASQSGGYGGQAVLVLPTSPRRLKLQQATSQAVLEKWGWSAGVFEYCAKSELHPAIAGLGCRRGARMRLDSRFKAFARSAVAHASNSTTRMSASQARHAPRVSTPSLHLQRPVHNFRYITYTSV